MKKTNHIFEETQREAIINRPHNLFGSVKPIPKERFCINEETIEFKESTIVPALIKIFMEAIDNPIDISIKHNRKMKIDITVTKDTITVKDDGTGIPNTKDDLGEYLAFKAFCKYNTSSNYGDYKNQGQKGVNGLGVKGSNTLSTEFTVINDDGNSKVKIISTENNLHHKISEHKSTGKTGVEVIFKPDFKIIDGGKNNEISEEHITRMREYVLMQSLTYPDITFTFNGKKLNYNGKKFISLFNKTSILEEYEDFFVAVTSNEYDDFKQISYVNGLETSKGGTHINYLMDNIVNPIREKLLKKFKGMKPADIRNKLQLILIAKNVKDIDWDGQTKESITTPNKYWSEYFKDIDFTKLTNKILKTPELIDPITEVYRIKEEFKKRQELKNADKAVNKKPKSEKFMPPIGEWKNIFLAEGDSAANSISKILGRQGNGFYAMFGVPPNAYDMELKDIISSKKMTDLQQILGLQFSKTEQDNINFKNIIITTDFDLPGHFIAGQLFGLFYRFGKNLFEEKRIKRLITPLIIVKDSKENIVKWFYSFDEYREFESKNNDKKYKYEYKKGLGSWDQSELEYIIEKDGLENMLEVMTIENSADLIDDWLSDKKADRRKEMLDGYEFNIMNL